MTQRRGRAIAMSVDEANEFLAAERTCRVATTAPDGRPHVAPLWFVWDGESLWLNSIVRSKRWADLRRDARVAIVIDAGEQFHELRGVEISGNAEVVGEVPRSSEPDDRVANAELLFARKYMGGDHFMADGRHAWLRIKADEIVSWDFRKNAALQQWSR
ncbi:pyridoxamine 5'-phosphate oxidase family protein [Rhodococcus sp. NPDC058481]|uniref:pyridoxamine 5'-phosphate oxidase family protein n=2 Tax=Rhodococcus TaxID=1827 RepID=UPI00365D342D